MNGLHAISFWLTQNFLTAAAFFFGGATLAVTLYTYVYDYKMLANRD